LFKYHDIRPDFRVQVILMVSLYTTSVLIWVNTIILGIIHIVLAEVVLLILFFPDLVFFLISGFWFRYCSR